jgi:riboflavin biosynthesis pyrimidine reductase
VRSLLPEIAPEVDVHQAYAAGWGSGGGVRVNFIASVDGATAVAGRSRGLQTPGDNRIFAALRDLADVVLVGAGTAREEGYAAIHLPRGRQDTRRDHGFAPVLPTAVVSRSLRLDPGSDLFTGTDRGARTIVLTCARGDAGRRAALAVGADVVDCGDDEVDLHLARAALHERGHRRILCEGGPTLFADLVTAGVADELCLTVSPLLAGAAGGRLTGDRTFDDALGPLRLTGLLTEDDALFCRYALR